MTLYSSEFSDRSKDVQHRILSLIELNQDIPPPTPTQREFRNLYNAAGPMNLSRVPHRTAEEMRVLVEGEVREIADAGIVQGIQT